MAGKVSKKNLFYFSYVLFILCLLILSFILISNEIKEKVLVQFDDNVIYLIQSHISPALTDIMKVLTFLGSLSWIAAASMIIMLILYFKKKSALSLFLLLSYGLGDIFNLLLKNIFKRQRPDIHRLIMEHGFSFPSGHSMGSFIFYGAIVYIIIHYAHRKGMKIFGVIIMSCLVLLIGMSRIYLGVHFPSDVIGGYIAGGAWLFICIQFFRYYEYRKKL